MRAQSPPGVTRQAICDYVTAYVGEHGYPPTIRESMEAVGLSSPSTVHIHLLALEREGKVERRRIRGGSARYSFAFFPVEAS